MGELFPTNNYALFTRTILTEFSNTKFSDKQKAHFDELQRMHKNGVTNITIDLLMQRQTIMENYDQKFSDVYKLFASRFKTKELPERILKNAASIYAPVAILIEKNLFEFDFTEPELFIMFCENIEKQANMGVENTDMAKFWDYIEIAFSQNLISEDKGDFKFKDDCLVIRLARFYDAYLKLATDRRENKILNKSSLESYLTTHPAYVSDAFTADGRRSQERFAKGSSPVPAWFFKYAQLNIDLKRTTYNPEIDDMPTGITPTDNIRTLTPPQDGKTGNLPF
jgi:hypothetical protein